MNKSKSNTTPKPVGHVQDPFTKQQINVVPKKGESVEHAIERIQARHSKPPKGPKS